MIVTIHAILLGHGCRKLLISSPINDFPNFWEIAIWLLLVEVFSESIDLTVIDTGG
jgi:hypothetical protein